MADEDETTVEDVDIMLSALIDLLVEKKIITEDEYKKSLDTYYQEE